ncbi:carotenoid oxygenase family protein [Marinicauda pacifica]|uniref:carotenoid oxygenase family protein n=1 Tax=Marinicauda pacifica TaxID=1133559 RepID=UPI0035C7B4D1
MTMIETEFERDELTSLNRFNPYLKGIYAPVRNEVTALELEVEGEIPTDLYGAYVRNGPNPMHGPEGMHHWFDGDGMLHAIFFENGKAEYRNRYIHSQDHEADRAGTLTAGGILEPARRPEGAPTVYKDTANTDVVLHNGSLMALWYVSGQPVRLDPRTLETIGTETFSGALPKNVSAHSKVDPVTGEFLFFDYDLYNPVMSAGVVSKDNELSWFKEIELPGPRLPHDMAITENYMILMDLPVVFTEAGLRNKMWQIHQPKNLPARFGVVRRDGTGDVKWFETEPCYIYHGINAWEEGDEIVFYACKMVPNGLAPNAEFGPYAPMAAVLALQAVLHRWSFNMKTGEVKVEQLDDRRTEFPVVSLDHMGRKSRYSYNVTIPNTHTQVFDGLVKYDLETGQGTDHRFAEGVYGSEPAFAPRVGAKDEDDGYVITFVTDSATGKSEALILDAKDFDAAPLARVKLPQRVPAGFHGTWAPGDDIAA